MCVPQNGFSPLAGMIKYGFEIDFCFCVDCFFFFFFGAEAALGRRCLLTPTPYKMVSPSAQLVLKLIKEQ